MRSTERLIQILASVNGTAIDNDGGKPGEFLAEVCHEAGTRLKELYLVEQKSVALSARPRSTTVLQSGQLDLSERIDLAPR